MAGNAKFLSFFREKAGEMAGIRSESIEKDIQNDT